MHGFIHKLLLGNSILKASKKQVSKKQASKKQEICNSLREMEKDEEKGQKEYDELITLISKDYPEYTGELNISLGDEINHSVTLTKIQEKLKCK